MAMELAWQRSSADVDDVLVERCRTGQNGAFDELVARYQTRLFRFALRILQDPSEAEDAVQDTFIRAYRALPAYRPDGYFSSWIYRITLNECRRRLRGRKFQLPLEAAEMVPRGPDPQARVLLDERRTLVRQALYVLPEHYRIVMLLFYFDDMSVDQISRTISVSVSAVKVRLHRGRERLSRRLLELGI